MNPLLLLLAEITAVFAVALLGVRLASKARAAVRHLILASAFGVVLILPLATLVSPKIMVEIAALPAREAEPVAMNPAVLPAAAPTEVAPPGIEAIPFAATPPSSFLTQLMPVAPWLLISWAIAALIALVPVVASLSQLRTIRRRGQLWPEGAARLEQLTHPATTRRPVVLLNEEIAAPITGGLVQPLIALPANAATWSDTHLANALLHELEHVRRHDWAVHLATRAVCALYWFHPLAWMAWRALRLEAERACDDAVLTRGDAEKYAQQLLELARGLVGKPNLPGLQMASTSNLSSRIKAALDGTRSRGRAGRMAMLSVVIVSIATVAALAMLRAIGPAQAAAAPIATSPPIAPSKPAADPAPAIAPTARPFLYDERVGLVALRDDGACLSIFNTAVVPGTKLTLVRTNSSNPAGVLMATVGERQAEKCRASLDRQDERGIDPTYYRVTVAALARPASGEWFAILDPPGSIVLRDGQIKADIDGDGAFESFETCNSTENLHYMIWTVSPTQSRKRWHGNVYVGYDMDPSCSDAQYAKVGTLVKLEKPASVPAPPASTNAATQVATKIPDSSVGITIIDPKPTMIEHALDERATENVVAVLPRPAAPPPPPPLGALPQGWVLMGYGPTALPGKCQVGVDPEVPVGKGPYFSVRCMNEGIPSFGIAQKTFNSDRYDGKRVRISGWLKVTDVEGVNSTRYPSVPGGAGLWLGVNSQSGGYRQDRMFDRSMNGSTDWELHEVVLDMPKDGKVLMVGFWLQGKGQVWIRDLQVEKVSKKVPVNFEWGGGPAAGITLK